MASLAGVSLSSLQLLLFELKLYWVIHHGPSLANRWEQEGGVNLYHCAGDGRGFFVEVGINDGRGQAVVLRSFSDSEALADYAQGVRLPEL